MRANFYLHEDSLKKDLNEDESEYIKRFKLFINDISFIIDNTVEENCLKISNSLYKNTNFGGIDIYQFAIKYLKRDEYALLFQILGRGDFKTGFKLSDIEPLTRFSKDEKECHIIVKMYDSNKNAPNYTKYIEFETYELVYDRHSWLSVRRQILGNHPGNCDEFMRRAVAYFPNITFSVQCRGLLPPYLDQIPRKIVYYLSCMNDYLAKFWDGHSNPHAINMVCEEFSGKFGFDTAGSQQGDSRTLDGLLCDFPDQKQIYCPLHFKITSCDANCTQPAANNSRYNARIYFQYKNSKIYVGRIGPHI